MRKNYRNFGHSKGRKLRRRFSPTNNTSYSSPCPRNGNHSWQQHNAPMPAVSEEEIRSCTSLNHRAYIGNESRTLEFKLGRGCYLEDILYKHVCIYGSAFLNSNGGILLIGVCDKGQVWGVEMNHEREDKVRQCVDDAIKTFQPSLFPSNYSLDFLPVIQPGQGQLKVVRLTFRPPQAPLEPTLFMSGPGEVYIKRDGSVQGPLSVTNIMEWNKLMWSDKVKKLEACVQKVRCEQKFLRGRFSWFMDPLHGIVTSIPPKDGLTGKLGDKVRLTWKVKVHSTHLCHPKKKRRYTA